MANTWRPFRNLFTWIIIIFLLVLSGLGLLSLRLYSTETNECSICRIQLRSRSVLGITFTGTKENEFSLWYNAQVEPLHSHNMVFRSLLTYNISRKVVGSASGEKYTFFSILPSLEKRFLEMNFDKATTIQITHRTHENALAQLLNDAMDSEDDQETNNRINAIKQYLRR